MYIFTLSKNRVMTIDAWSAFEEIIRYLKNVEIDNNGVLQQHLCAMTPTMVKRIYSQELRSAIDPITQNEESKIGCDYVMIMRNNKLSTRWRNFKQRLVELFFSPRFELWNLESDTFHNHNIT